MPQYYVGFYVKLIFRLKNYSCILLLNALILKWMIIPPLILHVYIKERGLLMTFDFSDSDLDFSSINELPCGLFDVINDTINETSVVCPEFVIGNHFTDNSQMSLADFGFFFTFRNGKTLQSDIENYMSNFKMGIDPFSKQNLSKQRMFIKPEYFKSLNRKFLRNIDYSINNDSLKKYKGFFLLAGDGSDEKLPDFPQVREEFNIHNTPRYTKPCMGKLSSIQDVLNGFLLDGILGNYKEGELPLMQENLSNVENMICPENSIFTFDRNYNAIELYARIIEMNSYFLVRLKDGFYKKEREKITSNDSPIQLELTPDRLKKFHDPELKEKYSKMWTINLRIVTITLKNGKTETLLTNLPPELMTIDDLEYIYSKRWGIETNYNTLKNRFYIENYSSKKRIGIEQDLYSKFFKFNIFNYLKQIFNMLIMMNKYLQYINEEYRVDQANLIRNINDHLPFIVLSPYEEVRKSKRKLFYTSCMRSPIKAVKHKSTPRKTNCNLRFPISYAKT